MSNKFNNPVLRNAVMEKCNGRCGYCGTKLTSSIFQIDHIVPKRRVKGNLHQLVRDGLYDPTVVRGDDSFENLMPCCSSCNCCKSDLDLEDFRDRISDRVSRLNIYISEYVIAKRFGLVKEVKKPVIFYFETLKNNG